MALNKSGLPPMKNPLEAAMRPGGPGTVSPGKAKSDPFDLGKIKGTKSTPVGGPTKLGKGVPTPNLAGGGSIKMPKGLTGNIPKIPKIPKIS